MSHESSKGPEQKTLYRTDRGTWTLLEGVAPAAAETTVQSDAPSPDDGSIDVGSWVRWRNSTDGRVEAVCLEDRFGRAWKIGHEWVDAERFLPRTLADESYGCATAAYRANNFSDAARDWFEVVARDPEYPSAWTNAIAALMAQSQYAAVVEAADRRIAALPGDFEGYNQRAIALMRLGRYPEALSSAREAIRRAPRSASAHNTEASVCCRANDLDAAFKALAHAVACGYHLTQFATDEDLSILRDRPETRQILSSYWPFKGPRPPEQPSPSLRDAIAKLEAFDLSPELGFLVPTAATAADLANVERSLARTLPASLCEFLSRHDGVAAFTLKSNARPGLAGTCELAALQQVFGQRHRSLVRVLGPEVFSASVECGFPESCDDCLAVGSRAGDTFFVVDLRGAAEAIMGLDLSTGQVTQRFDSLAGYIDEVFRMGWVDELTRLRQLDTQSTGEREPRLEPLEQATRGFRSSLLLGSDLPFDTYQARRDAMFGLQLAANRLGNLSSSTHDARRPSEAAAMLHLWITSDRDPSVPRFLSSAGATETSDATGRAFEHPVAKLVTALLGHGPHLDTTFPRVSCNPAVAEAILHHARTWSDEHIFVWTRILATDTEYAKKKIRDARDVRAIILSGLHAAGTSGRGHDVVERMLVAAKLLKKKRTKDTPATSSISPLPKKLPKKVRDALALLQSLPSGGRWLGDVVPVRASDLQAAESNLGPIPGELLEVYRMVDGLEVALRRREVSPFAGLIPLQAEFRRWAADHLAEVADEELGDEPGGLDLRQWSLDDLLAIGKDVGGDFFLMERRGKRGSSRVLRFKHDEACSVVVERKTLGAFLAAAILDSYREGTGDSSVASISE